MDETLFVMLPVGSETHTPQATLLPKMGFLKNTS